MTIGDKIRVRREYIGLTQEQVADFLNVTRTVYASYEQGKSVPTYDVIENFINLFKVYEKKEPKEVCCEPKKEAQKEAVNLLSAPEVEYNVDQKREKIVLSGEETILIKYVRCLPKEEQTEFLNKIMDAYLDVICALPDE